MPDQTTGLEVALIGMSVRLPGAHTIEEFWRNLCQGVESITFFSDEELERSGVERALYTQPNYVRAAPILDDIEGFDTEFFGFSPREAEITDPQHRLLLECAWEALEDAGHDPERFMGPIGVYAGTAFCQYLYNILSDRELVASLGLLKVMFANDKDYLVTRIAYKLNLEGPAVTVQTACSTSLVAVHLACQALISGECEMALAGGVALKVPQRVGYFRQEGEFFSPDGHCRAFDASAAGTISGSGGGLVVLRRLEDALAAGDHIYTVIKGTAINNDGARKVGYSAPRADGQAKVIRAAQVAAEVDPATLGFVEAHGTGTAIGDPIELNALTRVFRASTARQRFCALGSVKTNVGHLDTAAGVAGLVKAALAVREGRIPATLHFERPLPALELDDSPFFVPTRLTEWPAAEGPRRAAVSSFGVGGTNAHVILEQAPDAGPPSPSPPWCLLTLAARSAPALAAMTGNLAASLRRHSSLSLADVAYTLQTGRRAFAHRRAWVARDLEDAVRALEAPVAGRAGAGVRRSKEPPVWFLFPGQGAQHVGMARQVYESEPTFRRWVDRCAQSLQPRLGLDLRRLLFPAPEQAGEAQRQLEQTQVTQAALFAVEYALAQLWMEWGVRPQALLGHSIGEYVAACLSGVLSFDDALLLVAARGRLMQAQPRGAMLAVDLPEREAMALAAPGIALAAVNAPRRCVLSGPPEAIDALAATLAERGIEHRRLQTSHAFHSPMMEPVMPALAEQLRSVRLSPPQIPFLSNLTGTWIRPEEATDPGYWCRHLRETVRFSEGLQELLRRPDGVLLEVGPGQSLTALVRQHPERGSDRLALASLPHPQDDAPALATLLGALGAVWTAGVEPDWEKVHAHERRRRVSLPTYPFERRRCWIDHRTEPALEPAGPRPDPLRRREIGEWFYAPSWRRTPPPEPAAEPAGAPTRWVVLADDLGIGEHLARELGDTVIVRPGDRFARTGDTTYTLDPRDPAGYVALLDEVIASGRGLAGILHLWTLSPAPPAGGEGDRFSRLAALQPLGYGSLVALARAAARRGLDASLRIELVTNGLHEVTGDEPLIPEKATLLGPLGVIPQEHPGARCRAIDVRLGEPEPPDRLAPAILAEIRGRSAEPLVAYRGRYRWVRSFEPLPLAPPSRPVRLREEGVYLITGGLGGIGLTLAEHLAGAVRARLALIGRSPLPERAEWQRTLAAGGPLAPVLRRLLALEEAGGRVLALSADVTRPEELRSALAGVRRELGPVRGVVHAAGIPGGGLLQARRDEDAERVLAPKVQGTLALAGELAGDDLDFFLLCSSTIALTGGVGQGDYCAANSFLDAFAHERSRAGRLTVAVNWDQWGRVGMAARRGSAADGPHHPLLGRRVRETAEQRVYAGELSAARHWVLDEHRMLGRPVLPGTALLELIAAAAADAAAAGPDATLEIRDAVFLSPLVVEDGEEREVRVVVERAGDGFAVRVVARGEDGVGWREHAVARVSTANPSAGRRHDVSALLARLPEVEPRPAGDGGMLHWGPRWQSVRRIGLGESEALAELGLPAGLADDLGAFRLHPALLDVATSFALRHVAEGSFLPISYERLTVHGRLPERLVSHVRSWQGGGPGDESIRFDLVLLDETGAERAEIEGFTLRRLGEARADGPAARPAAVDFPDEDGDDGILPEEGVEAFRRILAQAAPGPQIVVATRDLQALMEHGARPLSSAGVAEPAVRARHERPHLASEFVAPRSETERVLAEIEQELLGVDRIGIHDNFFELGGDSMIGIQVFSRATQAGLKLTTGELFQNQTIAELAAAADRAREAAAPAAFGGAMAVSPLQAELLERGPAAPGAVVWWASLGLPAEVGAGRIEVAAAALAARHPALCLRFAAGDGGWQQSVEPPPAVPLVQDVAAGDAGVALASTLAAPAFPPLRLALLAGSEGARLAVAAHGAAVDAWSWPALLGDLRALLAGAELPPAPPGVLGAWSRLLAERERDEVLLRERQEWTEALRRVPRLPAEAGEAEGGRVESRLDPEATRALLDSVPSVYRTETDEVLATALALALHRRTGGETVALELERDGRAWLAGELEAGRAVGCFAYRFPVVLEPADDPGTALRAAKDRIRLAPGGRVGEPLPASYAPEILLRCLGAAEPGEAWPAPAGPRRTERLLEVTADVAGGALRVAWDYREGGLRRSTVEAIAHDLLGALRELIDHCRSAEGVYTLSDFRDAELSQDDFEDILARFDLGEQDSFDDDE